MVDGKILLHSGCQKNSEVVGVEGILGGARLPPSTAVIIPASASSGFLLWPASTV